MIVERHMYTMVKPNHEHFDYKIIRTLDHHLPIHRINCHTFRKYTEQMLIFAAQRERCH